MERDPLHPSDESPNERLEHELPAEEAIRRTMESETGEEEDTTDVTQE